MTTMTTPAPSFLPPGQEITRADLQRLPDDGHRYELIDGALIVSPAPRPLHQRVLKALLFAVSESCPATYEVLFAPVDVVLSDDTIIQPDLIVAPREAFTETELPTAPLLAIEVLSPSTRGIDLLLKKDRLERAGCPHYWVIDPSNTPAITAWALVGGTYRQAAHAINDETFQLSEPFPITFTPASLLA